MAPSARAPRTLRAIRALNEDRRHLEHHTLHIPRLVVEGALPDVLDPVTVTLPNPRNVTDIEKLLKSWGIPLSHHGLDMFAHHHDGGWGVFRLPPMVEVYSWVVKAAKHRDAVIFLHLLAMVALWSHLTLSAALALISELAEVDPRRDTHPGQWAEDWALVHLSAIDAWQARQESYRGLGDVVAVAQHVHDFRVARDEASIRVAEMELEVRRAKLHRSDDLSSGGVS